ncbi:RNA binding protein [Bacillus phage vB_BsuM-Goe2]|uniref:RNA binding protein n=1 Tax=Bacillus phage vB_BsuM-Goe2 TaxID=1933062 RepID=A0A1Z1DEL4_9CAUD|nr:RNA binding protein [Bacillus phage vB_BsuM-Goe2]
MSRIGQVCEAFRENHWEPATIISENGSLSVTVRYEDGETEELISNLVRNSELGHPEVKKEETTQQPEKEEGMTEPKFEDTDLDHFRWYNTITEKRPDNSKLFPVVSALMAVQYDKEGTYGSSWVGKGEHRGIMPNIDRKYDRLDTMTANEIEGKAKTLAQLESSFDNMNSNEKEAATAESKIDAVADLANYCLLYMTFIKDNFPKMYNAWFEKNVPQYLRDKFPRL